MDTSRFNTDGPLLREIDVLTLACLESTATVAQRLRLQQLICEDPVARRSYIRYMHDSMMLRHRANAHFSVPGKHDVQEAWTEPAVDASGSIIDIPDLCSGASESGISPTFLSAALHGTTGFLSSGWPVAYLVATVIVGIGLVIGNFTYVSQPAQVARQSAPIGASNPQSPIPNLSPKAPLVGRITGMVDCRWEWSVVSGQWSVVSGQTAIHYPPSTIHSSSHQPLATSHLVSLGDRFTVTSGLMEITYNSGAKVILQGPVTYDVESAAGGFLSVGKLTARVEKKVASGQWPVASKSKTPGPSLATSHQPLATSHQSPIPNPSSLSTIHYPLFTIRTPTATVTDLGTEFGVEVNKEGDTETHVIEGVVQAQFYDSQGGVRQTVRLKEGEARQYRLATRQLTAIPADQGRFQRRLDSRYERWLAYSRQLREDPALVVYYTFESAGQSNAILPNQSAAGSALDGRIEGGEWVYGRLPGKMALYFHGAANNDYVVLPQPERFTAANTLSVAVWFKVERFTDEWQTLIATGRLGWRLLRAENSSGLAFATLGNEQESSHDRMAGRTDVADGRWHLAVAVYEPAGSKARKRLYIDGRLDAECEVPLLPLPNDPPLWLGTQSGKQGRRGFWGWIDEVAIFARALSAEEVTAMFQAGQQKLPLPQIGREKGE